MKNEIISEMNEVAFNQWRHHPVTAAVLQFLRDQAGNFREQAADLWEAGALTAQNPPPHLNPDMLRGQVIALKDIAELRLEQMQEFYNQSQAEEQLKP